MVKVIFLLAVSYGCKRDFFVVCGETWKKMRPRNVVIFYTQETCYSKAPSSARLGLVRSGISGHEKVS